MIRVRVSTDPADSLRVYPLLVEFGRAAGLPEPFSTCGEFSEQWGQIMRAGAGFLVLAEDGEELVGILGAFVGPRIYWPGLAATESFWWVRPECRGRMAGVRMLKEFEAEAKRRGCSVVAAGHKTFFMADELARLYQRLGYQPLETMYLKGI